MTTTLSLDEPEQSAASDLISTSLSTHADFQQASASRVWQIAIRAAMVIRQSFSTDSPMHRSLLGIVDQGIVSVASFATVILLGRFTSEAELGLYCLPLTVLMVVANLQGELVTSPYSVYRQRREGRDLALYTGSSLIHQGVATIGGMLVFAAMIGLCELGWLSPQLKSPFQLLLVAGPFWLVRSYVRYLSFANLRFDAAVVVDLVATVVQMGLLVLFAATGCLAAETTYLAMGSGCLAACVIWFRVWRFPMLPVASRAWGDWLHNWGFARWAILSQLVCCTTPQLLPWLLAYEQGEGAAGRLAACTNLCGLATLFVLGVANGLTPQAARSFVTGGAPALIGVLRRVTCAFLLGGACFCIAMYCAGDWAMRFIYGTPFGDQGTVLTLLAFGVLANSMAIVAGNGLWAVDRPRANLIADTCTLLVTLAAALLLIEAFGVAGAAAAICLGNTAGALTRGLVLRRVLRDYEAMPVAA